MILIKLDDHFPKIKRTSYFVFGIRRGDILSATGILMTLSELEDAYTNNCEIFDMYWGIYDPCKI